MSRNSLLEAGTKSEGEVTATSDFVPASSKEFLTFRQQCGFTLKRVPDMTRTYSQKHRDKSEHTRSFGQFGLQISFEPACFEQGVP